MGFWADTFGGGNTFKESVANVFTPNDGKSYVGGELKNSSSADASFLEKVVGTVSSGVSSVVSGGSSNYTIKSGDTLSAIAKANGTTVSALLKANPSITDANKIYAGSSLKIPGAGGSSTTAATGGGGGGSSSSGAGTAQTEEEAAAEEISNEEAAIARFTEIAKAAGVVESNEDIQAILDDPNGYLAGKGMTLSDLIPTMDPNAEGTTLDPTDPRYSTSGDVTYDATQTEAATVSVPNQAAVPTIDTASAVDRVNSGAYDVNAVTGTVKDEALVDAEGYTIDMKGAATGVNADGTVNQTGAALNDYATVNTSRIIDTSTVAGKLLAQKLGEGNYIDSKATTIGMMKIISEEFKGPNGEPVIPSWASSVLRTVGRSIAFGGATGTGALGMLANATMEATLAVAQQDVKFIQDLTIKNLDNRQESIINKANVLSKFEVTNLSAREAAAVENAKAFLQMDIKNLDNAQQAEVINKQARLDAMFTQTAEENVNRRLNVQNELETRKFYDRLALEANTFNASAINATREANANRADAASRFNIERKMARDQFEASMAYNIDVSNANWRRTVETTNTSMKFEAAATDVKNALDLSTEGLNRLWDRVDSTLDYIWRSTEADEERDFNLMLEEMKALAAAEAGKSSASGSIWGAIIGGGFKLAASIFSDERLKDDIEYFDTLSNGVKLYTWKWNEEAKRIGADVNPPFGVIAQQIKETHPDAIYVGADGYLRVNYGMIQ